MLNKCWKKYIYRCIHLSTFSWNLKEVLLLHTFENSSDEQQISLWGSNAVSLPFLLSFHLLLFSHLSAGERAAACWRSPAQVPWLRSLHSYECSLLRFPSGLWCRLPPGETCFQSWRKICKAVRERHLHLWNSLTCYSETLWVEKEGNHYLPVTHPPAHFPPAYSPESADFSLSLHKGRNAGKKLNYTLPSRLTCWFLSGIIEVLDNWLFHASVGERCL